MDVVELRLRSAENLKDVRRLKLGKLLHPDRAVAWLTTSPPPHRHSFTQLHPATYDHNVGTLFPTWQPDANSDLRVSLDGVRAPSNTSIVLQLLAHRRGSTLPTRKKHRLVGTATIPLNDIVSDIGGPTSYRTWQLLSYNLRGPSGRNEGILNLSARVR
ncbi:hypothetical protein GOP47_0007962 [Adiantum capillus-veneris]|uniref:Uncharacterized protein n=1 Tax=Adiantum capillus-veneris TaxID=13818 RepID=A0A9D4V2M1_ADICA|nr:hypothetical protein GOP47_0007962 [Adiantum capillus-veneris]